MSSTRLRTKNSTYLKGIAGIAYTVLFAEFFLRIFAPVAVVPRHVTATHYGLRGNEPNRIYRQVSPEYDITIRINAQGIRADEVISYAKPPGVKRIVVLGDSFGMGYEVDLADSFLTRMEQELKSSGINAQVVNLSVSGHGNAEELITLREEGLKYDPDVVLLCWHSSDYPDNVRSGLFSLRQGELKQVGSTYLPSIDTQRKLARVWGYEWVASNSQLYSFSREWLALHVVKPLLVAVRRDERPGKEGPAVDGPYDGVGQAENLLAAALLKEIERTAQGFGADFLILDTPVFASQTEFVSRFPVDSEGGHFGLPVVSASHDFKQHLGEKLYWDRWHMHYTPLACRLVGHRLAREMVSQGLLAAK
jgi:hypothetical protein